MQNKSLYPDWLEAGWFVTSFSSWPCKANSKVDVEKLCEQVYPIILAEIDKWIKHVCNEEWCKN